MEKLQENILATAMYMFIKYGLKPVTMDDVAAELKISKKTLYKHVPNKEALVKQTVEHVFSGVSGQMRAIGNATANAIDELFEIDEIICTTVQNHDYSLQFQLKRYYPETYAWLEQKRKSLVVEQMRKNLEKGQAQGLYLKSLNSEIIALLYYSRMVVLIGEEIEPFKGFDVRELMQEIRHYHIRGVASAKGLAYLEKRLNENKINEKS